MSHIQNLILLEPNLMSGRFLDVGAGRGEVLIEACKRGINAQGIELNSTKVGWIRERIPTDCIVEGSAEQMPYPDMSFDFLNMCELIEHVVNPKKVLCEAHRVLNEKGKAYLSFPNRFSICDTHFHIWFVNWFPRFMADGWVRFLKKSKVKGGVDLQQLSEMHYYTFSQFKLLAESCGFEVEDTRLRRLQKRPLKMMLYFCMRPWYFRSSHVLLKKRSSVFTL